MDNQTDKYIGMILDDRYEILELIGSGGMSVVYKALCHRLNRYDAIKMLRDDLSADSDSRDRFQAESQAVAMLSHPNIVSVYDMGHLDDIEYIVMELIDGITLKQYMQKKGALGWKEALHFSTQIAKALDHAHSRGIIHRDIKPQNIMLLKDGTIKVADFGIAEMQTNLSGTSDQAIGSVHYMAPEQAKGAVADARSDIYSLGIVMYEMLTGALPFTGETTEEIAIKHINGNPVRPREINPDIPQELEDILLKAMSADLVSRYQSAGDMLAELEAFRKNQATAEVKNKLGAVLMPEKTPEELAREEVEEKEYKEHRKRSRKVTILSGVFGVLLVIIALLVFLWTFWLKGVFTPAERVELPDFVGKEYESVINDPQYAEIYKFNVKLSIDTEHEYGTILSQSPEAGSSMALVEEGVAIELTISSGFSEIEVPEIITGRYTFEEAAKIMEESGFVAQSEPTASETVKEGYVIGSSPQAGEILDIGKTVYLLVSTGPEEKKVDVPNLVGRTEADAKAKLEEAGLAYGSTTYKEKTYDDESMYGLVIWQSVSANTTALEGTRVYIEVSTKPKDAG